MPVPKIPVIVPPMVNEPDPGPGPDPELDPRPLHAANRAEIIRSSATKIGLATAFTVFLLRFYGYVRFPTNTPADLQQFASCTDA